MEIKGHIKYPRTPHLSWSPGATSDDKWLHDLSLLTASEIVVTEKLDGENTTIGLGFHHARSLDSASHPSRNHIAALAARLQAEECIPIGWRFCGENVWARHSIAYDALPSPFMLFSVWSNDNECQSWDDTVEFATLSGLQTVPVLYRGHWDENAVRACFTGVSCFGGQQEGYVVRPTRAFHFNDFGHCVAKFVRAHHVQTDKHWMQQAVVRNGVVSC